MNRCDVPKLSECYHAATLLTDGLMNETFKVGDRVALLERNSQPTLLQLEKMV